MAAAGGAMAAATVNFTGSLRNCWPSTLASSAGMVNSPVCFGVSVKRCVMVELVWPLMKLNWLDGPT